MSGAVVEMLPLNSLTLTAPRGVSSVVFTINELGKPKNRNSFRSLVFNYSYSLNENTFSVNKFAILISMKDYYLNEALINFVSNKYIQTYEIYTCYGKVGV